MPGADANRMRLATCLWPGLPQLWLRGSWAGLGVAVGFTATFNLLLLTTVVWTEWLGATWLTAAWMATAVIWSGSGLVSARWCAKQRAFDEVGAPQDLFPRALGEYLRGNWYEVETLCHQMLRAEARDVDAQLLLASTLRHAGRRDEAGLRLDELGRFEAATKWKLEIEHEMARLAEAADQAATTDEQVGAQQGPKQLAPKLLGAA
ncbi:MAG TPA: hypothetical protein VND64_04040 [Pirellulales bacterium]|nr:hypothetical protein [Pirellulales bacterium]